jgi:hypothetical protein
MNNIYIYIPLAQNNFLIFKNNSWNNINLNRFKSIQINVRFVFNNFNYKRILYSKKRIIVLWDGESYFFEEDREKNGINFTVIFSSISWTIFTLHIMEQFTRTVIKGSQSFSFSFFLLINLLRPKSKISFHCQMRDERDPILRRN